MKPGRVSHPASFIELSEVTPVEVQFLWKPYLPIGKLTGLVGDPGVGKTHLAAQIAAAISSGGLFLDGTSAPLGSVLYFSVEDGFGDTIVPRLIGYGADLRNMKGFDGHLDIRGDAFEEVAGLINKQKPRLIIFDPIQCYIGTIDMNRANEVRDALTRLMKLADENRCAVMMIMHMNKSNSKATYRALGSIDFVASMRSMISMGRSPYDESTKAIIHSKMNCGPTGKSLGFKMTNGFLECTGESKLSEADLFGASLDQSQPQNSLREAIEHIRAELVNGPVESSSLTATAKAAGISQRTLERAKKVSGAESYKGLDRRWFWHFPDSANASVTGVGGLESE